MNEIYKLIDKIESDSLAYYSAEELIEMLKDLAFELSEKY
jgi:hypothetical protein